MIFPQSKRPFEQKNENLSYFVLSMRNAFLSFILTHFFLRDNSFDEKKLPFFNINSYIINPRFCRLYIRSLF